MGHDTGQRLVRRGREMFVDEGLHGVLSLTVKGGGQTDAVQDGFSPCGLFIREVPLVSTGIQDSPVCVVLWGLHGLPFNQCGMHSNAQTGHQAASSNSNVGVDVYLPSRLTVQGASPA